MHDGEPSMLRADGAVVLPEAPPSSSRPAVRDDAPVVWAAGFWRRTGAALFDTLIVLPVVLAVILSAAKLSGLDLPSLRHASLDTWLDLALAGDPAFLGALGLGLAVVAVYLLLFQALVSHTIGMRAFRLEIIDLGGAPLTPRRATPPPLGYLASLPPPPLGFLWVALPPSK